MKKQSNPQLVLALIVIVRSVLLLVDSIRTSPLTFTFAKEPPLPVIFNDPDGHMPYTWEADNWDVDLNPKYFFHYYHFPTGLIKAIVNALDGIEEARLPKLSKD
jgi:hypothetical protein